MLNNKCSVCGGNLRISLDSEYAQCENCGNSSEIDRAELGRIRDIYENAERKIRLHSIAGYTQAINLLQTIRFANEARDKIAFCEAQILELKKAEAKRAEIKEQTDKNDTKTGIIIIIMIVLVILLAVAGAIYVAVHFSRGDLSTKAVTAIISVIIIFTIITIIGKIKS